MAAVHMFIACSLLMLAGSFAKVSAFRLRLFFSSSPRAAPASNFGFSKEEILLWGESALCAAQKG